MKIPPGIGEHLRSCASDNDWAAGQIEDWILSLPAEPSPGRLGWLAAERIQKLVEAEAIMRELDRTFEGRDADGAPSADGSYWLGHTLALQVWYWLHPEKIPTSTPEF